MEEDWFKVNTDDIIKRLKISLDSPDLLFIGRYVSDEDKDFGFFKDVRSLSGVRKYYPTNNGEPDEQLTRPVEVWSKKIIFFNKGKRRILENGKWYKFFTSLSHQGLSRKQDNPFLLQADLSKASEILDFTGFELIENIQQDSINTPASVKGKLTRSIEAISNEINTQPATFIFELIQNADDYPNEERAVNMSFEIKESYLIIKHNGSKFEVNNAVAICDINEGDKRDDIEKIGFKGIGFKSIFKDSNLAYIRSGEYSFKFDEIKWRNEGRNLFWQITPINTKQDEYENLINPIQNVNLVIRPREVDKLSQYQITLKEHFTDERILLFLRNVKRIDFFFNENSFHITASASKWKILEEDGIVLNKEVKAALDRGITLNDGRIPLKFQGLEKTEISFGFRVEEKKIYFLDDATIYAYLPTKVNLGFGFLINGNFIPDGSRTTLHKDILWNEFLFEKAGELLPQQLLQLIKEGYDASSVINLIPNFEELLTTRDKDIIPFIEAFKKGFNSCIEEVSFIPNQKGELVSISNVILDETGISEVIEENFYHIFKTEGELISSKIEKDALNNLKKYLNMLRPEALFTLDDLYASYKKGSLNTWLLVPENNTKFIIYLAKSTVIFNKFRNESVILGYDNFDEENIELYPAKSLYINFPVEAQFIVVPIVCKKSFEAIQGSKLDFTLIEFNMADFLKIILEKADKIRENTENLNKAWHFLYLNRQAKIDGSLLVNERFKKFPIKTLGDDIKSLEECFAGDIENPNSDFSFLYNQYGKDALTKVDVSAIAQLVKIENKAIVNFLSGIHEKVKLTDKQLFSRAFKTVCSMPKEDKEELLSDTDSLIQALVSVFNFSLAYPNENLLDGGIMKFPILTASDEIEQISFTYFGNSFSLYFEESELYAEELFQGIDGVQFISEKYLSAIPEADKQKFVDFLKKYSVSSGLKYFSSLALRNNYGKIDLCAVDSFYKTFNMSYHDFKSNDDFYVFRDVHKLAGLYENLRIFWSKIAKVKPQKLIVSEITCNSYTRDNPFLWLLVKAREMFPMQDGSVKSVWDIHTKSLSYFLNSKEDNLDSCFSSDLQSIIDKIPFKSALSNSAIIRCLHDLSFIQEANQREFFLKHFAKALFNDNDINIIRESGYLLAKDNSIQKASDLIYLDQNLDKSLLVLDQTTYSDSQIMKSFDYDSAYKEMIIALGLTVKGPEDIELRQFKEKGDVLNAQLVSLIKEFGLKNISSNGDIILFKQSEFTCCDSIELGLVDVTEFYADVDYFYANDKNVYYYKGLQDLIDLLGDKFDWSSPVKKLLKKNLENNKSKAKEEKPKENPLKYTEEEISQIKKLFGRELAETELEEENLYAQVKALRYFKDEGYDVSGAEDDFETNFENSYLSPVIKNGESYKILCRSARRGVLFFGAYAWLTLDNPNTILYLLTGNNSSDCHIINNSEELEGNFESEYKVLRRKNTTHKDLKNLILAEENSGDLQLLYKIKDNSFDIIFNPQRNKDNSSEGRLTDIGADI